MEKKDSPSTAGLTQDWVECGGDSKGWYYVERSPGDTGKGYQEKSSLKHYAIQRCMQNEGYRYIGVVIILFSRLHQLVTNNKYGFGIREHAQYGTVIDMAGLLLGHPRLRFIVDK